MLHSLTDRTLPISLIDIVSSAQITIFRNQKRSIASSGIVYIKILVKGADRPVKLILTNNDWQFEPTDAKLRARPHEPNLFLPNGADPRLPRSESTQGSLDGTSAWSPGTTKLRIFHWLFSGWPTIILSKKLPGLSQFTC